MFLQNDFVFVYKVEIDTFDLTAIPGLALDRESYRRM